MVKGSHDIICHSVYITDIAQNHFFVKSSQSSHLLVREIIFGGQRNFLSALV